jgi:predicted DNA-binding transcriptional regulator YafY
VTSCVLFENVMRASRLLRILLLLQNRGRLTSGQLADELEVARRTILRDVDALTEAGLPIIVHQGNQGGIELGFNYRTRLTGLAADEAEAMALILTRPMRELEDLGIADAADRARSKMLEAFPDTVRTHIERARRQFRVRAAEGGDADPRIAALAEAVRAAKVVRIRANSKSSRTIHPVRLIAQEGTWSVVDALAPDSPIPLRDWGDINVSARQFGEA